MLLTCPVGKGGSTIQTSPEHCGPGLDRETNHLPESSVLLVHQYITTLILHVLLIDSLPTTYIHIMHITSHCFSPLIFASILYTITLQIKQTMRIFCIKLKFPITNIQLRNRQLVFVYSTIYTTPTQHHYIHSHSQNHCFSFFSFSFCVFCDLRIYVLCLYVLCLYVLCLCVYVISSL